MVGHVTSPPGQLLEGLPGWVTLVRAPNPGPMTLDGTNTWLLRPPGTDTCVVIDPGPRHEEHLRAVARSGPPTHILATHSHPDHVEGLPRFRELAPAAMLPGPRNDSVLVEAGPLVIRQLPAPGHTLDSVVFVAECGGESVALTGDTILGRGTTVVAYPDGDLGRYLDSLRRLERLGPIPVLPGHGPALADCSGSARFYLNHRLARLEQVRAARERGAQSAKDVVAVVYADVARALWPAAELSVRAQLAYLEESSGGPPRLDAP